MYNPRTGGKHCDKVCSIKNQVYKNVTDVFSQVTEAYFLIHTTSYTNVIFPRKAE